MGVKSVSYSFIFNSCVMVCIRVPTLQLSLDYEVLQGLEMNGHALKTAVNANVCCGYNSYDMQSRQHPQRLEACVSTSRVFHPSIVKGM